VIEDPTLRKFGGLFEHMTAKSSTYSAASAEMRDESAQLGKLTSALLATGGDGRISLDPANGRNRYGTRTAPSDDEISFSSTTATNVSREGFLAASMAIERLILTGSRSVNSIGPWFDDIRHGIHSMLGVDKIEIVLAASGTDAELIILSLVAGATKRPLTNILIAPNETGSGIPRAAAGLHYSDTTAVGSPVGAGQSLDGISAGRVSVEAIAIRGESGEIRDTDAVDDDLIAVVERELRNDRDVIVHILDASKTGVAGVSRQAARHVAALAPGRVWVVVDACQLRCSRKQLRDDLADGFVVAVTGSKFLAGPAFAGALLLPPAFTDRLGARTTLPAGLADYSAENDWPKSLRDKMSFEFHSGFNLGLGLRWTAASAGSAPYFEISDARSSFIKEQFVRLVRRRLDASRDIILHPHDEGDHIQSSTIVPITFIAKATSFATLEQVQAIHRLMRDFDVGPVCHLGQAVCIGPRSVLRIAASAADIIEVEAAMSAGAPLGRALQPIETRLDIVFEKLAAVQKHLGAL
jgi:hypothetical protein